MTNPEVAVFMLAIFIFSILLGFPIWITLMAMGIFFGYYAYYDPVRSPGLFDNQIFDLLVNQTYSVMANDVLVAVPLFLFMGYVVERANLVDRLFVTLQIASRRIPGSMAVAALATCALFATATGIIGAVVTLMGMMAFPAMLKAKYDTSFAAGVICAGGCLGILIPPSIMLIVYAAATNVSVVRLYAGAIIPGFMLAGLYMLYVVLRATLNPKIAPKMNEEEVAHITKWEITVMMMTSFFPLAFLILSVLGAILFGLATPSEAASMGAVGGLLLATLYRLGNVFGGKIKVDWAERALDDRLSWIGCLGWGSMMTIAGFVVYFILRLIVLTVLGMETPADRTLPGGPGVSLLIVLTLAFIYRNMAEKLPLPKPFLPTHAAGVSIVEYAGIGAIGGIVIGAVMQIYIYFGLKAGFVDSYLTELNVWGPEVGFFVGTVAWLAFNITDWDRLKESVYLSVRTSAMVCWLFVGSWTFSSVFSYLGGHDLIQQWVLGANLTPITFLLLAQVIIFLLGWPLEWSEIIIIFIPIFLPMLAHFGVDPLFFGILVALNLQTSFLTPPMAMAAYYLKGVAPPHVQLVEIFRGVMPFLLIVFFAMFLLYQFPAIAMWLPEKVYGS